MENGLRKTAGPITHFTRTNPRNYVPVFAGMSPNGVQGSGELNMATNVAAGLRDAGMNAVLYDPTPEKLRSIYRYYRKIGLPPREAMMKVMDGVRGNVEQEASLYRLGRHMYTMSPIESLKGLSVQQLMEAAQQGEFSPVLSHVMGATPKETVQNFTKFKRLLDRGAFDGITPGGLRDHLLKGKDAILNGRVVLGNPQELFNPANAGNGKMFFDGHLGMNYSDMPHGKSPVVGNGFDLGQATGFNANYNPADTRPISKSVIPFTDVGKRPGDGIPLVSWFRGRRDRRDLSRMLSEGLGIPEAGMRGKKLVMLSGGATGENIGTKMRQVNDAIGNRNDVLFLVNSGTDDTRFKDVSAIADELNKGPGGPRYLVRRGFSPADSRRFSRASDLNLSYGGSSTLSETLAQRNPSVFLRDTPLNENNVGWATNRFGNKVHTFDSSGLAAKEYAMSLMDGMHDKPPHEGFFWRDVVGTRHVPGQSFYSAIPGLSKNPTLGEYRARAIPIDPAAERSRFGSLLNDMLDNPGKYRRDARSVSNRFMRALGKSNENIVSKAMRTNGGLYFGKVPIPWWLTKAMRGRFL